MECWYRIYASGKLRFQISFCWNPQDGVLEVETENLNLRAVIDPSEDRPYYDFEEGIELVAPDPEKLDEALDMLIRDTAKEKCIDPEVLRDALRYVWCIATGDRCVDEYSEEKRRQYEELFAKHDIDVEAFTVLRILVDEAQSEWEDLVA